MQLSGGRLTPVSLADRDGAPLSCPATGDKTEQRGPARAHVPDGRWYQRERPAASTDYMWMAGSWMAAVTRPVSGSATRQPKKELTRSLTAP